MDMLIVASIIGPGTSAAETPIVKPRMKAWTRVIVSINMGIQVII